MVAVDPVKSPVADVGRDTTSGYEYVPSLDCTGPTCDTVPAIDFVAPSTSTVGGVAHLDRGHLGAGQRCRGFERLRPDDHDGVGTRVRANRGADGNTHRRDGPGDRAVELRVAERLLRVDHICLRRVDGRFVRGDGGGTVGGRGASRSARAETIFLRSGPARSGPGRPGRSGPGRPVRARSSRSIRWSRSTRSKSPLHQPGPWPMCSRRRPPCSAQLRRLVDLPRPLQGGGAPAFLRPGRGRRRRRRRRRRARGRARAPRRTRGSARTTRPAKTQWGRSLIPIPRPVRARPRPRPRQPAGRLRLGQVCRLLLLVGRRRGLVGDQRGLVLGDLTRTAPGATGLAARPDDVPVLAGAVVVVVVVVAAEAAEAEVSLSSSSVSCASSDATVDSAEDTASASDVVSSVASGSPAVTCSPTVAVTVATWPATWNEADGVVHRLDRTDHVLASRRWWRASPWSFGSPSCPSR